MSEEKEKASSQNETTATPAKGSETGDQPKKLMRGGHDPKVIGAKTQIKKGERRNPTGRPKTKPITAAFLKVGNRKLTKAECKAARLPQGSTWNDMAAFAILRTIVKDGDMDKFEKVAARTDGPVPTEISGPDGGPIPIDAVETLKVDERISGIALRLIDRVAGRNKAS